MQSLQFPVFCMEHGPPVWFYSFADEEQLQLHLVEFADMPHEFVYWDGCGLPVSLGGNVLHELSPKPSPLIPLVTEWLREHRAWHSPVSPTLDELPGVISSVK